MNFPAEVWAEKRKKGLFRYLLIDGVIFTGGPFAVVMQIIGVIVYWSEYPTFSAYFTDPLTWFRFLLHGGLFGLIVGYIKWRRNEAAFASSSTSE